MTMGNPDFVRKVLMWVGLALAFLVLLNLLVRKLGGWKRLFRWIRRTVSHTVHAFVDPIADRIRYRKRLRFLSRMLRDPSAWSQSEQAMAYAQAVTASMVPYALALTRRRIGVLVAGDSPDRPVPEPWEKDPTDPRLWWIKRTDLAGYAVPPGAAPPEQTPLLACLGVDSGGTSAIMIDLLAGPPSLSVYGVQRTAQAVVQALAAQLDVRLPAGSVEVAEGIHGRHDGMPLADAIRRIGAWFVVGAETLDEPVPAGIRLVNFGVGRGSSRLIEAVAEDELRLHGAASWLEIDPLPLAGAVARSVRRLPPHDFESPQVARPGPRADDLDDLDLPVGVAGVSVLDPSGPPPDDPGGPGDRADGPRRKASSWN